MPNLAKVTLIGHLGRDPELKYSANGNAFTTWSMATTRKGKDRDGNQTDETTWWRCTSFGKTAENANQYLKKGSAVYVEGRVSLRTYTDKEGKPGSSLEVEVTDLQFLSAKQQEETQTKTAAATAPVKPAAKPQQVSAPNDDDIPF